MFFVYVLYSAKLDRFYVGWSKDVDQRLYEHNEESDNSDWTYRGRPWVKFLCFQCKNQHQAMRIERHIKRMKSKVYIKNLKRYPEMIEKLKLRYS